MLSIRTETFKENPSRITAAQRKGKKVERRRRRRRRRRRKKKRRRIRRRRRKKRGPEKYRSIELDQEDKEKKTAVTDGIEDMETGPLGIA